MQSRPAPGIAQLRFAGSCTRHGKQVGAYRPVDFMAGALQAQFDPRTFQYTRHQCFMPRIPSGSPLNSNGTMARRAVTPRRGCAGACPTSTGIGGSGPMPAPLARAASAQYLPTGKDDAWREPFGFFPGPLARPE